MASLCTDDNHSTSYGRFLTQGKQSRIYLAQTLVKVIGTGKGLTQNEANTLARQLYGYHDILHCRGWLLPQLYCIRVNHSGLESELIIREQYIPGSSLTEVIADKGIVCAMQHVLPIVKLLCAEPTVKVVYHGKALYRLCYGVDLKPDNIVLNSVTNELVLVDTFAPKTMRKSGSWCRYSKKLERLSPTKLQIVTATRAGILLRLLRLMGLQKTSPEYGAVLSLLESTGMEKEELHFIASEVSADIHF